MRVDITEYPDSLSWNNKSRAMPHIPRGNNGYKESIRIILEMVQNGATASQQLDIDGSSSHPKLEHALTSLRPSKLVIYQSESNRWLLSEEAKKWLETKDDLYLAAFLCSRFVFISEILHYLDEPKTALELLNIAKDEYGLPWKGKSEILLRMEYLRDFGLVILQEFSSQYFLTDLGKEFVKGIKYTEPQKQTYSFDETIDEQKLEISDWAVDYCAKPLSERKASIGYTVGTSQITTTISEYIQLLVEGMQSFDQIAEYSKENHSINAKSVKSFLASLENMDIIKRIDTTHYEVTNTGKKWYEKELVLDLLCIIHRRFAFVFEMLLEMKDKSLSCKELAAIANLYGFSKKKAGDNEIRKRLTILRLAKLIRETSMKEYTITNRGRMLLDKIEIEKSPHFEDSIDGDDVHIDTQPMQFYKDLRIAAKDSSNYARFEELVKEAFEKLGFEAQRISGAGNTDVIVRSLGNPEMTFTVAVDAKSTMNGTVSDGQVDFDTLAEHKRKHKADYSAVVGDGFGERLVKRAVEHGVVLIDVDTLETLVKDQEESPIQTSLYKVFFEKPGIADLSCLEEERKKIVRYGVLLHAIMDCLIEEQDDDETKGVLPEREIRQVIKATKNVTPVPSVDEISVILQFLASPLIECVAGQKDGYYAIGSLDDARQKFSFYSRMFK